MAHHGAIKAHHGAVEEHNWAVEARAVKGLYCRSVSQIRNSLVSKQIRTKSWIRMRIKVKIGSGSHKLKSRIRIIRHTTPELDLVGSEILIITVHTSTNSKS
jgi:hypothetical protein